MGVTTDVPRWTVFNNSGDVVASVVTPRDLAVTAIGSDWVLGIWADRGGAQHVRMYRLTKQ